MHEVTTNEAEEQHRHKRGIVQSGVTQAFFTSPTLALTNILNQSAGNWGQLENISEGFFEKIIK